MRKPSTRKTSTTGNKPAKKTPARKTKIQQNGQPEPRPQDLQERIAKRAYELAERRGFAPGHEAEDWYQAEEEIRRGVT